MGVALLLLALSRCGADKPSNAAEGSGSSSSSSSSSGAASSSPSPTAVGSGSPSDASAGGEPGVGAGLRAGGKVLPNDSTESAGETLRASSDKSATATTVRVLTVPADEGFWIGSPTSRVWVQLHGAGESQVSVRPGAYVSFTGVVRQHGSGFAEEVGVTPEEGATDLNAMGAHVRVARAALKIAD